MDDYSLDAVAREVLGEGKALTGNVRDRIAEIAHNYRHDLAAFALYARTDARLAFEIAAKLDLVRLAFARSADSPGMTPDRVAASIASFDFLYLSRTREARASSRPRCDPPTSSVYEPSKAATCSNRVAGLHRNVWVFDFKSLYPSIIRTFNIDPLSYVADPPADADVIRTPGGAFRRAAGDSAANAR